MLCTRFSYLVLAVFVVALNKAVTLNGFNPELNGNLNLNALCDYDAAGSTARLCLAFDTGLAAALGFNLAKVCLGADFDGKRNIKDLFAELVAVALSAFAVLLFFKGIAGIGVNVHFKLLLSLF